MFMKKIKIIIVFIVMIIWIISCINPVFPKEQLLQHFWTFLLLLVLFYDIKNNKLSLFSYICFSLFIIIHIIWARYIYSYVPYNDWLSNIFNIDINNIFDISRNHYDRFVHLFFWILILPYFYESFFNIYGLTKIKRIIIAFLFIQSISMFYELFEWWLTLVLSPESADNYNWQQWDIWDAQKDMALAMFGSFIMIIVIYFKKEKDLLSK